MIDCEVNDDNVLFKFASGLSMVYEPDTGETDSGGDGVSMTVITCQPCLSGYSSDLSSFMVLPDESAGTIAETFGNYTYSEETNYDDEEVTLFLIKSFGANQIVLWHGHGGYSTSLHSYLRTGDDYSSWYVQYWADYVQDRIIESSSSGKACITAAFIDEYCGDLDNSLFYLAACHSGADSVLADSFLNKGAAAAVGMSDTILTEYDLLMMHAVMTYMTQINSATVNYHTLSEALDAAKEDYGATDSDYAASGLYSGSSSGHGAYPIIFGGTDAEGYRLGEADESPELEPYYVITDLDADGESELLICAGDGTGFYYTWTFVYDQGEACLIDEFYGYGQYRYSSVYNAVVVPCETKPDAYTNAVSFYRIEGAAFNRLFSVVYDTDSWYYNDSSGTEVMNTTFSESEYSEGIEDLEWISAD